MIKNIKDYKNKRKIFFIILTTLMILSVIYFLKIVPISKNYNYYHIINEEAATNVGKITEGIDIKQSFKVDDGIKIISIKFLNNNNNNNNNKSGIIELELSNKTTGEKIQVWKENINKIKNDDYHDFVLNNPIRNTKDQEFQLNIKSIGCNEENSITICSSRMDQYKDGTLYINDKEETKDIAFRIVTTSADFLRTIVIVCIIFTIIFMLVISYLLFIKKIKTENVFLISGLCLGLAYMFLTTPYSGYDEPAHVDTAYRYSNDMLLKGHSTEDGGYLRRGEDSIAGLTYGKTTMTQYRTVFDKFFDISDDNELVEVQGRDVSQPAYVYFPSALAITIARIVHLGQIPTLYLGRFFNLIAFLSIVYLAIKKMPIGKVTMFIVALLPMTLQQATSFSYDAIINALAFLYTAYCLYFAYSEKEKKKKDIIILFISGILLAPLKMIYVLLCALALIIPKKKFVSKKKYYQVLIGLVVVVLASYLVFNLIDTLRIVSDTDSKSAFSNAPAYSFGDIITSPLTFIKLFINNLKVCTINFIYLTISGLYLININPIYTIGFIILLILSSFRTDEDKQYITKKQKIIMFFIVIGIFFAIHVVGFTWTNKGAAIIEGVQGRYMIPVLSLIFLMLRNSILTYKKNIENNLMFFLCTLQVITLWSAFISLLV